MRQEVGFLTNVVLALVGIGLLAVFSASALKPAPGEVANLPGEFHFLLKQGIFALVGLVALGVTAWYDYHALAKPWVLALMAFTALVLLVLVFVPGVGITYKGATRSVNLAGLVFQPSEFAKLAMIVLVAVRLCQNQEQITSFWKGFLLPMAYAGAFALLILFERDLGTPAVLVAVALLMVLMAGARWPYVAASVALGAGGVVALCWNKPYRWERLWAVFDPWKYKDGAGYHIIQSLAAFVRGLTFGCGLGAGEQKLHYLPEPHTDFIFAVWGEEMGLVGTLLMVGLFLVLLVVGLQIAVCARDLLGALLAGGIVSLITVQAAFNMAVALGLAPTKGLTLPFISAGGSALIVNLAMIGILMNVGSKAVGSKQRRRTCGPHSSGRAGWQAGSSETARQPCASC